MKSRLSIGLIFCVLFCATSVKGQPELIQFVDPFIGTENGGNVFLGAAVPFGMVKLGHLKIRLTGH